MDNLPVSVMCMSWECGRKLGDLESTSQAKGKTERGWNGITTSFLWDNSTNHSYHCRQINALSFFLFFPLNFQCCVEFDLCFIRCFALLCFAFNSDIILAPICSDILRLLLHNIQPSLHSHFDHCECLSVPSANKTKNTVMFFAKRKEWLCPWIRGVTLRLCDCFTFSQCLSKCVVQTPCSIRSGYVILRYLNKFWSASMFYDIIANDFKANEQKNK